MFENLLHQDRIRDALLRDLEAGELPHSMLFAGPEHSGKLSAALELARGLSCSQPGAPWSCRCNRCNQHRLLDSPYVLLMGTRYFLDEIRASAGALAARPEKPLFYLFHRNVKKLIRRFDPVLWQDDEKKLSKAAGLIDKLEDMIESSHPESAAPSAPDLGKLVSLCADIEKLLPGDGISINMIRRATYWAHTADSAVNKTIIIENAHEMNDAARNAFLKILEEPPRSVYFILLSSRPGAIIPTIRSRLRTYRFACRGQTEYRDIISRIYREPNADDYSSLQSYFIDQAPGGLEVRRKEIELMFELLNERSIAARDELAVILGSDRGKLSSLVSLCLEEIQKSHLHREEFMLLQRKLEDIHYRAQIYNIPVASALEVGYI
jgi:DNA polymerase-3 subunit gamma/tau